MSGDDAREVIDFYAYMLRCSDGSYYLGHTDDLDLRVAQHQQGSIPGYTQKRRPVALVWAERFPDRDSAFAAERQIKGWSRAKKEALIRGDWAAIRRLASRAALRDAGSTSSPAPQDEREENKPITAHPEDGADIPTAHPEEGLSPGEGPSRRTTAASLPNSPAPRHEQQQDSPHSQTAHPEEGLSPGEGPSRRTTAASLPNSPAPRHEQQQDSQHSQSAHPEEGLSPGEGPSRRTTAASFETPLRLRSAAPQDERDGDLSSAHPNPARPPAIVLVRPQLGENIGKAARAMLNFGLTDLRLVSPRDGWPNPSAGPAASGADNVLEQARVFDTVAEAVADCGYVYATTVRKRGLVVPVVGPAEAAAEMRSAPGTSAILFGAERSGLETDEVAIAHKILTVPVNPDFRSLNLAQAVILVAYEWSKGAELAVPTEGEPEEPRATQEQLEGLIQQIDGALEAADYFFPPDRTPATKNTIRTILTKAGWSNREVQALRGMIRAITHPRRRRPPRDQ